MPRRYRQSPLILHHGRRQQLTTTNFRNIYRIHSGYYVNKMFMRHQYRAYFSINKYGRSYDAALAAAVIERDWLDKNRRRILDRLQVKLLRSMLTPSGRRRRQGKVQRVNIRRVVREVLREVGA